MNIRGCVTNQNDKSDPSLPTVFIPNGIVGCDASWNKPGLPFIQHICDAEHDFHLCETYQEVIDLGMDDSTCSSIAKPGTFYITNIQTEDNIYGCGTIDHHNNTLPVVPKGRMNPFGYALNKQQITDKTSTLTTSWRFNSKVLPYRGSHRLIDNLYKINNHQGGVLCCRSFGGVGSLPLSTLTLVVLAGVLLTVFVYKLICGIIERLGDIRDFWCPFCGNWDGIIRCCCGRIQIPCTRSAYFKWKREVQVNKLRRGCKTYSDLLDGEEISESSGHCVICLDEYEKKSSVMRLPCGHNFHADCFLKWIEEKEQCPICLQNFQNATDRHHDHLHSHQRGKEDLDARDLRIVIDCLGEDEEHEELNEPDEEKREDTDSTEEIIAR